MQACITESLGRFVFPLTGGGMGGRGNGAPPPQDDGVWRQAGLPAQGVAERRNRRDGSVVRQQGAGFRKRI